MELALSLEKMNFTKLRELWKIASEMQDGQLTDFLGVAPTLSQKPNVMTVSITSVQHVKSEKHCQRDEGRSAHWLVLMICPESIWDILTQCQCVAACQDAGWGVCEAT